MAFPERESASEIGLNDIFHKQRKLSSPHTARALHLLVVDDNAINQLLIKTLVELAGHSCALASSGAAAIETLQASSFDAVLMDLRMPDMNGLEATRQIRALGGKYAQMPIIAMTASTSLSDQQECSKAGMNAFLSKPLDRESFWNLLQQIAQHP